MNDLKNKAKKAVFWNAAFTIFRDLVQFGIMLVLVRIIPVAEYGKFALLTSILNFISIFSHNNFLAHTVQLRNEEDVCYQTHFTAGTGIQLLVFLATNIVAVIMRLSNNDLSVTYTLHLLSLIFILELPCGIRCKMLERDLDWKRMRILHAIGIVLSSALSIILALLGFGVIALLAPTLLIPIPFIIDLFFVHGWRPDFSWNWEKYREAWKFGLNRIASEFLNTGKQLLQTSAITKFMSYAATGLFSRANGLGMMFCYKIAFQLLFSLYPVLTKFPPASASFRRISGFILRIVCWYVIPVSTIFALLADPVIKVVYGEKWLKVIPLLPPAMLLIGALSIGFASYRLALANEQKKACLIIDLISFLGSMLCLLLLLKNDLFTLILALSVNSLVYMMGCLFALLKGKGIALRDFIPALLPPILGAGIGSVAAEIAFNLMNLSTDGFFLAFFYGIIFISFYGITIRLFFAKYLIEIVEYLPAKKLILRLFRLNLSIGT